MPEDFDSGACWEQRYRKGRASGDRSYSRLAQFKADFLKQFVLDSGVTYVVEKACGDGAQLAWATYPQYMSHESESALEMCRRSSKKTIQSVPELRHVGVDIEDSAEVEIRTRAKRLVASAIRRALSLWNHSLTFCIQCAPYAANLFHDS